MGRITIDPVTRIEGHLKIEVVVDGGEVKEAKSSGTLFRGLEIILVGRDPRDAKVLTQRICGVCPIIHATASSLSLDSAFGIAQRIPNNGRIIRNLILGSNYIQSHLLHFYHLSALDFVDLTAITQYEGNDPTLNSVRRFVERGVLAPFLPRYESDYRLPKELDIQYANHYLRALEMRRKAHEMLAIFGGRAPHEVGIIPGGVTEVPTIDKIVSFLWRLNDLRDFIDNFYIPDVLTIAQYYEEYFTIGKGCGNLLSYGVFDLESQETNLLKRKRLLRSGTVSTDLKLDNVDPAKITEEVGHSWYSNSTTGRNPEAGETKPEAVKKGAYSWIKSPRYEGKVYEVGPLAKMLVTYFSGESKVKSLVDSVLSDLRTTPDAFFSVLGRHLTRALECKYVADSMADWVLNLKPGEPINIEYTLPEEAKGMGLVDGPRGALGHWIEIKERKIKNYQAVVPTTWNASPRDDQGKPGPIEQALMGTKVRDEKNPIEIVRVVRSFDPCLACAVHLVSPKGRSLGEFRVS